MQWILKGCYLTCGGYSAIILSMGRTMTMNFLILGLALLSPGPGAFGGGCMDNSSRDDGRELLPRRIQLRSGESQRIGRITINLAGLVFEEIAEAPGAAEAYPAGSGASASLLLNHDFGMTRAMELELLSPPYGGRQEGFFFAYRLRLTNVSQGPGNDGVELQVSQEDELSLQPLGKLRLELDKWQYLAGLGWIRFTRHGHKQTEPDGPDSPLIVVLEYRSLLTRHQEVQVQTRRNTGTWAWRRWRFYLLDFGYGEWMEVLVARSR